MKQLAGLETLWGADGEASELGERVLRDNLDTAHRIAEARAPEDEASVHLNAARDPSYSVLAGLGDVEARVKAALGAGTSIDDASTSPTDQGPGLGSRDSALGAVVAFKERLDENRADSANKYFAPLQSGDWSPETALADARLPSLKTAAQDGAVSEPTLDAYMTALAVGQVAPWRMSELLFEASEVGDARIAAGVGTPLSVMAARNLSAYFATREIGRNDNVNATNAADTRSLRDAAVQQATNFFVNGCGGIGNRLEDCFGEVDPNSAAFREHLANKALYRERMTYGLEGVTPTTSPVAVPADAEVLLETRFSYLSADQRREVLRSTALDYEGVLMNGFGRLNLMDAADGYGAFDSDVTVAMNVADGGVSAQDVCDLTPVAHPAATGIAG